MFAIEVNIGLFCVKCGTRVQGFEISIKNKKTHMTLLGHYWEKLLCCNVCNTCSMLLEEA
jgi:hypothetical protein